MFYVHWGVYDTLFIDLFLIRLKKLVLQYPKKYDERQMLDQCLEIEPSWVNMCHKKSDRT